MLRHLIVDCAPGAAGGAGGGAGGRTRSRVSVIAYSASQNVYILPLKVVVHSSGRKRLHGLVDYLQFE